MANDSISYREFVRKLGYRSYHGQTPTIKNMIQEMNIDTSHFKNQGWNKDNCDLTRLRKGNNVKSCELLRALILTRGYRCECCGLSEWCEMPIPLEVHHKDEDTLNNEIDNLQLLCRNCHGITDNFKGRSNRKIVYISDDDFLDALRTSTNVHRALNKLNLTPKGGNYKRAYDLLNKHHIHFNDA
jgi:hypothetical protein